MRATVAQRFGFLLPAVFIACRNEAISSETRKAERWSGANHGSIRDCSPIAFSGCPRGPRVGSLRLGARARRLTGLRILTLEPERPRDRPAWPPCSARH